MRINKPRSTSFLAPVEPIPCYHLLVALLSKEQLELNGFEATMKVDRNGSAAVLTSGQLDALLNAAPSPRYRALWSIQRWTAGRISECLALTWGDLNGVVTYRKGNTKTKTTRQVPTAPQLRAELEAYQSAWEAEHGRPPAKDETLFPAKGSTHTPMSRQAADKALRQTCATLGLMGVSTHSFRRSFATGALRRGVNLPTIQKVTGHKSLGSLGHYLDVDEAQVMEAVMGA
jgi:integrase/recombinase XerD